MSKIRFSKIRYRFDDRILIINDEVCAIITGFDKYAISMFGNVYNIKTGKQLKPGKTYNLKLKYVGQGKYASAGTGEKYAYYRTMVNLTDNNGKQCSKRIYKLVAQEWLKETDLNPDGTPIVGIKCINHIDHDTTNNNVVNLEYCDYKYNGTH